MDMPRKHFFRATPKYRRAICIMNGGFKNEGVTKSKRLSDYFISKKKKIKSVDIPLMDQLV